MAAAIQQLGVRDRGACIVVPHLQASVENDVLVLMDDPTSGTSSDVCCNLLSNLRVAFAYEQVMACKVTLFFT